ncbi:MAG: hypothetical protein F6K00_34835 [Leptolyngbya sp. SIOISBB]|nr:hypothetical protein [Leptolyngbya sp. SIOISBB]
MAYPGNLEVQPYAFHVDAVLMELRSCDPLPHLLFAVVFDRLVGDVVQQHPIGDGRNTVLCCVLPNLYCCCIVQRIGRELNKRGIRHRHLMNQVMCNAMSLL